MRIVDILEDKLAQDFSERARAVFIKDSDKYIYTEKDIEAGELVAIRWNERGVLVARLDLAYELKLFIGWAMPPINNNKKIQEVLAPEAVEKYLKSLPWDNNEDQLMTVVNGNIKTFAKRLRTMLIGSKE